MILFTYFSTLISIDKNCSMCIMGIMGLFTFWKWFLSRIWMTKYMHIVTWVAQILISHQCWLFLRLTMNESTHIQQLKHKLSQNTVRCQLLSFTCNIKWYVELTAKVTTLLSTYSCVALQSGNRNKHGWYITYTIGGYTRLLRQGIQSGPVPGTFTRLRTCIVPTEITEPPKISGGQNHKYDGR